MMNYEKKYKEMKARVLEIGRGYVKGVDFSKPRQISEYIDPELKENESLQQEHPEDKQIIIITESHGDANIEWDCRSLSDVIVLLKSAESFITEKQIEKIAGPGSGPDYSTTEGRYSHLFKHQQEQPKMDIEKELISYYNEHFSPCENGILLSEESGRELDGNDYESIAHHFYKLGLNAKKEE